VSVAPVDEIDFSAHCTSGPTLSVTLTGSADLNVRDQLEEFVIAVHDEVQRAGAREAVVDVRTLEFMNSSCLKTLVWWISHVQDLPAAQRYRITFLSSPAMYWQRRSLAALAGLASDLVSVSA
jgi:hypothetical protein